MCREAHKTRLGTRSERREGQHSQESVRSAQRPETKNSRSPADRGEQRPARTKVSSSVVSPNLSRVHLMVHLHLSALCPHITTPCAEKRRHRLETRKPAVSPDSTSHYAAIAPNEPSRWVWTRFSLARLSRAPLARFSLNMSFFPSTVSSHTSQAPPSRSPYPPTPCGG